MVRNFIFLENKIRCLTFVFYLGGAICAERTVFIKAIVSLMEIINYILPKLMVYHFLMIFNRAKVKGNLLPLVYPRKTFF